MKLAIKELRKKLHISQADFAKAVGVSMRHSRIMGTR